MSDYITRERNLTLLTDYYEYTMVNGYFHAGIQEKIAVFDVFFRRVPENGGFAIYAGLQQIIELINGLSFTEEDIEYFRKKGCFSEKFFNFLRNFKFRCDVWSIKEGTPTAPHSMSTAFRRSTSSPNQPRTASIAPSGATASRSSRWR